MTEMVKGKTIEEAKKLTFKELVEEIGGLPAVKMHCAVLSVDGLQSAIRAYEEKHGLVEIPEVDESFVRSRLRHVMNPRIGRDIVSSGMVVDIRIEEGKIEVDLDVSRAGEFESYVLEEVSERLKGLPTVKEVKVNPLSEP